MSKKTIIAMVLVAGISTLALSTQAQARGNYNGCDFGCGSGYNSAQIPTLTAEQQTALTGLRTAHEAAIAPIQKELVVKQAEYSALMRQANPDPAAAGKAAGELADIRQKLVDAQKAYAEKVSAELGIDTSAYPRMGMGGFGGGMMGIHHNGGGMQGNFGNSRR